MIDKIKMMGLDLTKDLHGHVRVETRDRWTGRVVDSQEKDNLVTNALLRTLMASVWCSQGLPVLWFPIQSNLLGGLLLFDNTITEAATNIAIPSSAKLVAYATQISDTTSAYSGSYNTVESVQLSNGFTSVWDFLTSQANGTISAIGRTSHLFGSGPTNYSANYSLGKTSADTITSYNTLGYDETNKYLYFVPTGSGSIGGLSYTSSSILRVKTDFSKISLDGGMPPASKATLIKTVTSSDGSSYGRVYAYDKYDNNFCYINGSTIHLIAMDGTHTTKTVTGVSGTQFAVTENYYWTHSNKTVYRISKTNVANVDTYTTPAVCVLWPYENDIVFAYPQNSNQWFCVLYPDGTLKQFQPASNLALGTDSFRVVGPYCSNNGTSSPTANYIETKYLGTIANLDSPVTKTSSQTMKITYTLTEA